MEVTDISFIIQLKGTENYKKDDSQVKFSISTDYLKYYYDKMYVPVFLVVVDTNTEEYCWLFVQKYINEELNVKKPDWKSQKTVTVEIPIENIIIDEVPKNFFTKNTLKKRFAKKEKHFLNSFSELSEPAKEISKMLYEFINKNNN